MKYCTNCGKELLDEAVICTGCGCATEGTGQSTVHNAQHYLQELSNKVKTEAIIWFVIASIQAVIGFIDLMCIDVTTGAILLVICVLNFVTASNDLKYSKDVLVNPSNIIKKYEPMSGLIVSLIYNLIFGGVIGVVGIIFGFVTRSYVMENKDAFQAYEGK